MNPDIVCCQPKDILYPWFMWRINKDRDLFGKIIVMITQKASDRDFTSYVSTHIKDVTVVDQYPYDGKDWRNSALNEALKKVDNEYVLFLEQDFLVMDGFFENLIGYAKDYPTLGVFDGNRLHPCCLLTRWDLINKTRKDFSVDPDVGDHFKKFTDDLQRLTFWGNIKDFALPDWYHMAGLTQNYRLDMNSYYMPEDFISYVYCCKKYFPNQHSVWRAVEIKIVPDDGKVVPLEKIEKFFKGIENV